MGVRYVNPCYKHQDGYMVGLTRKGEEFYFDEEDLDIVLSSSWYIGERGYLVSHIKRKPVYFHRLIMKESDPSIKIDHIDNNPLNNNKGNLRRCNHKENIRNGTVRSNNTSGFKGVSWDKQHGKWSAYVNVDYKKRNLGLFTDILEAAKAYNEGALKYHGEFASLNSI